ncbi:hypothetical protein DyAD56_21210 [Dyella sp. AD56]|uniref:hypothetical protein n=1 Tax=Dyella sp. AD56 TaxID=1528744 RepID=UPI000C83D590|nr:hypothetical protein [Dyella sp. AD56]PMQ03245.1 hypothetical protein DyAD56_21210 [Dyella sp. AD56]
MHRHHEIEFAQFIDTLYCNGAANARWDSLYLWFGTQRITKSVWQRIHQAWADLSTDLHPKLEVPALFTYKFGTSFTILREAYASEEASMLTADGESKYTRQ